MTIEQAKQKAIDGGFEIHNSVVGWNIPLPLFDPLFWQALGKAMGWNGVNYLAPEMTTWQWRDYLHDFIDHIADGGTIESYFEQL